MDVFSLMATIGLDSSGFTSGLTAAGDLMKKFAGEVVQFGKDVIDTGMGFDKQMSAVEAVLGKTEGTVENMERLRAFALDQASDSIFTAEQTGEAYYYMGMAGWKTEQMLSGLPAVLNLAAASGEDLGMVSDIVTDSLTAFRLSAEDAGWYADILAQTATNANTDVRRMGQTFQYVAPLAGAVGADVDDVALAISLMASQSIKGTKAGTALRNVFSRLGTDTGNARTHLEELGVTVFDESGNMRDFGDILMESREAWKGLTDQEQIFYAKSIAGQYGMAGWMAMMNASEEQVNQLTQAYEDASGAAKEMADTRLDSLAGDVDRFNSKLNILKVAIYDDVKGPLREVVQYGTDALDRITEAINERGLTGGIEQLGTEIEAAGEKFAPMLESLGTALGPLLDGLINTILPKLTDVGVQLGTGLIQGISNALGGVDNPILQLLGSAFGGAGGLLNMITGGSSGYEGRALTQKVDHTVPEIELSGGATVPVDIIPQIDVDALSAAIEQSGGGAVTLPVGDISVSNEAARELWAGLSSGEYDDQIADQIAQGATGAGDEIATDIGTSLSSVDASGLESAISGVGVSAGAQIRSDISSQLSSGSYHITVSADVTGLPNAGTPEKHAKSMYGGTIMRGATMFGYNAAGQPLIGGDAGAEAIIGLQSLDQMIHQSVGDAFDNVSAKPADESKTLTQAVAGGLQMYGPELAAEIAERVGNIVASAVARIASRPMVVEVGGKALATATVDYNAMAANSRNKSYARGYGVMSK